MRYRLLTGILLAVNWSTALATVTVDLVCEGHTVIVFDNEELSKKPWSETFSFKNGVERYRVYKVSDTHLSYSQAPQQPADPDYKLLYESIRLNIDINRLSGMIKQTYTFKINQQLKDTLGEYRYQIDRGKCSPTKKRF